MTDTLAAQLYTLRTLPLEDALAAVAAAGYRGVEVLGTHGLDAPELRGMLDAHGLTAVSCHVPLEVLEADLNAFLGFQEVVGNRTLVIPFLAEAIRPADAAGWQALGGRLGALGALCRERGFTLLYHNHAFEMVELDGKLALEWLFEPTSPDDLGLEPDVAWMVRGGRDPLGLLATFSGRCPRAHVKDLTAPGENPDEGGWADVGHGVLTWSALLPALKDAGVGWFIVEHDEPRDPASSVRRSADFLREALAKLS